MGFIRWITGFAGAIVAQIQYFAIVLAVGMGIGAYGTYWLMNTMRKAEAFVKAEQVQTQTKADVKDLYQGEKAINTKVDEVRTNAVAVNKEIARYVPATVLPKAKPKKIPSQRKPIQTEPVAPPEENVGQGVRVPTPVEDKCDCVGASPTLSLAAVWVLNAQRSGLAPPSATWLDAAAQTPTEVGMRELYEADASLSAQCLENAVRHNALIDYVENLQARQNGESLPHPQE